MGISTVLLWVLSTMTPAMAGGSSQAPPGFEPPPAVSSAHLPASAKVRPKGDEKRRHPVEARLLFDRTQASPGQTLRVGVHLVQDPGWHTYWKSPGDIGLPTEINWGVPDSSQVSDFAFPVPHRFEQAGIVSYGYDDQVLFFADLTLPTGLEPGPVSIGAEVKWLVCEVQCIKGQASLQRSLDVVAAGAGPGSPSPSAPLFDHFASQHPTPINQVKGLDVAAVLSPEVVGPDANFTYSLIVSGSGLQAPAVAADGASTWPAFTPIIGADWMLQMDEEGAPTPPTLSAAPGAMKVELKGQALEPVKFPGSDQIGGLIQVRVGQEWVRVEYAGALPWKGAQGAVVPPVAPAEPASSSSVDPPSLDKSMWTMLFFAFVGGIILNIMPCVLPVLSLKIYGLVEQKDAEASHRQMAGLFYTLGVVLSFLALGGAVIIARTVFDLRVGWGQQFQSPTFVITLATIVFVFGLSLLGVFEVPAFGANKMSQTQAKEGWLGHLLTGAFATLLATPCSAPFLGTGIGFALTLPPGGILLFFGVAGLGLALPFLLIAYVPALVAFLPQPGAWMETFKQVLGFTLVATTIWLMDTLAAQTGEPGLFGFLWFLLVLSLACWIVGRWAGPIASNRSKITALLGALFLSGVAAKQLLVFTPTEPEAAASGALVETLDFSEEIPWQAFSEERVDQLAGRTVFVDFTADWCLTCKANEKTVLATDAVRGAMAENDVVPLVGDFTRYDPVIQKWLDRYGRAGVPMYLVIPADRSREAILLPEALTPGLVIDALKAG